jgi:hypothetical protein
VGKMKKDQLESLVVLYLETLSASRALKVGSNYTQATKSLISKIAIVEKNLNKIEDQLRTALASKLNSRAESNQSILSQILK